MAEMLVRTVDGSLADPYQDAMTTKRGDVIAVCPDGWVWGREELRNPEWRVLKFPGVPVSGVECFTAPDVVEQGKEETHIPRIRGFALNLDHPHLDVKRSQIVDTTRSNPLCKVPLTTAQIMDMLITKEPLANPNVLV